MDIKIYEPVERKFEDKIREAFLTDDENHRIELGFFEQIPVDFSYDEEGTESYRITSLKYYVIRFSVKNKGNFTLNVIFCNDNTYKEKIFVSGFYNKGFIKTGDRDKRYFSYSDGTSFFPVGINLAFPRKCIVSDGKEFGISGKSEYMGIREYERWFKKCAENGVNMARIWIGHDYFTPDTKEINEYNPVGFARIDKIFELAEKYDIKLKLTIEQFRIISYDETVINNTLPFFIKQFYYKNKRCENTKEWMTEDLWKNAWLGKIAELEKRYGYSTQIFAVELWNEMNCITYQDGLYDWNREMIPKVKSIFKNHMVTTSVGSLDCENVLKQYSNMPWDLCDFKQMHRYLDQGAGYENTRNFPPEVISEGIKLVKDEKKPFIVAETGAVNNCHSGEFRYYSSDDRGLIFVDSVYTPVFTGCAGCGNIWHWDHRYVESKNLYKYFKPLSELTKDIDFQDESFQAVDLSDDEVYLFLLEGKNISLCYIRNKADNWKNVLRDLKDAEPVKNKIINVRGSCIREYPIWKNDTSKIVLVNNHIEVNDINYGTMFTYKK